MCNSYAHWPEHITMF